VRLAQDDVEVGLVLEALRVVNDAIGSYSWDEMNATLELNAPNYAQTILSTKELVASIQKFGD